VKLKQEVVNIKGEKVDMADIPDSVFGIEPNYVLVSQYVRVYLTNQTQGTSKTKTRAEVSGGGKKPWKQKGTGRARHGSIRSPIWSGGGIAHGPKPRAKRLKMSKKMRKSALYSVLSERFSKKNIIVLDTLKIDGFKTKEAVKITTAIKAGNSALFVIAKKELSESRSLIKSFNLSGNYSLVNIDVLNAFDVLGYKKAVFEKESLEVFKKKK